MLPSFYTKLTDEEFIRHMDEKASFSPIIAELVRRLEHQITAGHSHEHANHRAECPVCAAPLHVEYDEGNALFQVKVDR
jgi:hypothetical protein